MANPSLYKTGYFYFTPVIWLFRTLLFHCCFKQNVTCRINKSLPVDPFGDVIGMKRATTCANIFHYSGYTCITGNYSWSIHYSVSPEQILFPVDIWKMKKQMTKTRRKRRNTDPKNRWLNEIRFFFIPCVQEPYWYIGFNIRNSNRNPTGGYDIFPIRADLFPETGNIYINGPIQYIHFIFPDTSQDFSRENTLPLFSRSSFNISNSFLVRGISCSWIIALIRFVSSVSDS